MTIWWLWSPRTQRETTRLLVALAPALDAELSAELEQAVLEGPPRAMYKPDRWIRIADYGIWLRLAKMDGSGGILTVDAKARLTELASQHPEWRLESDEREEFPIWGGESGDGRMLVRTPRRRRELVDWLKHNPEPDVWQGDDWLRRCVDDFPLLPVRCAPSREMANGQRVVGARHCELGLGKSRSNVRGGT